MTASMFFVEQAVAISSSFPGPMRKRRDSGVVISRTPPSETPLRWTNRSSTCPPNAVTLASRTSSRAW
ncbi:hypothetical protein BL253_24675 [Pseudofrankia asymbiotica]|uniref:Uncharacterized protein n=1 Tax=Pseudofrankia asymbiotica TaxID=1834516 RepID=A0A1V2I6E5_9ACTN|nr:hypothetical protein BL253_24675 [Pseudofrankia asymbiotica]